MKPTSIRLTDGEYRALQAYADANQTTVSTLIRIAVTKLAEKLGALPRTEGAINVSVRLWPADKAALQAYQSKSEHESLADAAQAALRVGLIQRGFLRMPKGSAQDALGA